MRRLILYFLLVASVAVIAQQQAPDNQEPAARDGEVPVAQGEGGQEAEGPVPGDEGAGEEPAAEGDQDVAGEDESPGNGAVAEEGEPDGADFEPEQEISEDYPVPLPSDI